MKIKALITTLAILGTTSVAMARPTFSVQAEAQWSFHTGGSPVVRDHREPVRTYEPVRIYEPVVREPMMFPDNNTLTADASVYKGPMPIANIKRSQFRGSYSYYVQPQWTAITAPTRIDRSRQFVTDLPDCGAFTTVRLQNTAGSTKISQVLIRFADGGEQLVKLDTTLDRWTSAIDIRLDGGSRKIHGFVVYGSSAYGSAYQILAL